MCDDGSNGACPSPHVHAANSVPRRLVEYLNVRVWFVLRLKHAPAHSSLFIWLSKPLPRLHRSPPPSHIIHSPPHHAGLVILSRRSRTLPPIYPFLGRTSTRRSCHITRTEHGVFERLDDGRQLHEARLYPLKTLNWFRHHHSVVSASRVPRA